MDRSTALPVHPLGHWSIEWLLEIQPPTWGDVASGRKKLKPFGTRLEAAAMIGAHARHDLGERPVFDKSLPPAAEPAYVTTLLAGSAKQCAPVSVDAIGKANGSIFVDPECRTKLCSALPRSSGDDRSARAAGRLRRWLKPLRIGGELLGAAVPVFDGLHHLIDRAMGQGA
jgi:hypothetical protein